MLAFTRRLPQVAASCMRQVHAAPAALQAAGSPSYTGTVYKESEKAREVRACAAPRAYASSPCGVQNTLTLVAGQQLLRRARLACLTRHATLAPSPPAQNAFFSKEDEKALRKLLTKVKTSADASCTTAGAHNKKEEEALHAIVGKHKLSDADMKALYAWRHSHDF